MGLGHKVFKNIVSAILERGIILLGQFVTMFLIIRLLPREQYGLIGVSAALFSFISFLNISIESIVLRDHKQYSKHLSFYLRHFLYFAMVRSIFILLTAAIVSIWGIYVYNSSLIVFPIGSIALLFCADSLVAPFVVLTTSRLKQSIVTKITFWRNVLNIVSALGLLFFPSLIFLFLRDLIICSLFVGLWYFIAPKVFSLNYKEFLRPRIYFRLYKRSLMSYSLWVHFVGVTTGFIYRADTFFLSFFTGMHVVGNYNIALTGANLANLLPSILGQQNSIALSNSSEFKNRFAITGAIFRLSAAIGVVTLAGFAFFGVFFLQFITGDEDVSAMYQFLMCIVTGLIIVKSIASPMVSYLNIHGDVKRLFFYVNLPVLIFSAFTYASTASLWGGIGVAYANILNAFLWAFLVILEVHHFDFEFQELFNWKRDIQTYKLLIGRKRSA